MKGKVLKDFKVRFVPLLLLSPYGRHYLRSICTASPIDMISQSTSLPTFPTLHQIAGTEPTLSSPSPFTPSLHNIQHKVASNAKRSLPAPPLALCYWHSVELPYEDDKPDSGVCNEARRGMVIGGECARLDAVVLGAYMECPALA